VPPTTVVLGAKAVAVPVTTHPPRLAGCMSSDLGLGMIYIFLYTFPHSMLLIVCAPLRAAVRILMRLKAARHRQHRNRDGRGNLGRSHFVTTLAGKYQFFFVHWNPAEC